MTNEDVLGEAARIVDAGSMSVGSAMREVRLAKERLAAAEEATARAKIRAQGEMTVRLGCAGCPICFPRGYSAPGHPEAVTTGSTLQPFCMFGEQGDPVRYHELNTAIRDHLNYVTGKGSGCTLSFVCVGEGCPCCCKETNAVFWPEDDA